MKTKSNGEIIFEDIEKAVSFRRWWHGIIYLISFISILYLTINLYAPMLEGVNILIALISILFISLIMLFVITFIVLLIIFIIEKLLAFLGFQIGRPSLKLFLSYFKSNYGFSYSDYLKYLIIKTQRKLEDPLNRGVYLDELKKSIKELKVEFTKIKNSLEEANMPDLNPSLMQEVKSVIDALQEILQLKAVTLDNKNTIIEYLDKLEKTIFSEDFKGLTKITLNFDESHKNSYLDKCELLFKLIPKKYFYGGIFFGLFLLILNYVPENYKDNILIIYVLIIIIILCFIRKE